MLGFASFASFAPFASFRDLAPQSNLSGLAKQGGISLKEGARPAHEEAPLTSPEMPGPRDQRKTPHPE